MNCKYISSKLIKKVTETYYKEYQNVLSKNNFPLTLDNVRFLYAELVDPDLNNTVDDEFFRMVADLNNNMYNGIYESELGKKLQTNIKLHSQKIGISSLSPTTLRVAALLTHISNKSVIVGGYVRDSLLGNKSKDVDFATDVPMEEVNRIFKMNGFTTKDVGEQFLVTIVEKDGEMFEIANFRSDTGNDGGVLGSVSEDAKRRDFTVNALYYDIFSGTLIDPNGTGIDDIETKTLRFVGNATHRLKEDPIRAMRFYRFVSKGLTPDKKSLQAVRARMQNDYKKTVDLQKVLKLSGVEKIVKADNDKKHSPKMIKMHNIDSTFNELQETLLSFERMRLEIERIVGV